MADDAQEIAAAAQVPAYRSNRFRTFTKAQEIRIVFGETVMVGEPPVWSTALVLSNTDARWLADLIEQQLLEAEKREAQESAGRGSGPVKVR